MFGWFKKKRMPVMRLNGHERLICNRVEHYLINDGLDPFHDPNIPTHYRTLKEELDIDVEQLQERPGGGSGILAPLNTEGRRAVQRPMPCVHIRWGSSPQHPATYRLPHE